MQQKYGSRIIQKLNKKGYRVTKLASTGGFLKEGNDTLLIGVSNEGIDQLKSDLQNVVLELESEKGWKAQDNRYTYFILNGHNVLPLALNGQ